MFWIPFAMALAGAVLLILAIIATGRPESEPPPFVQRHPGWFVCFRGCSASLR